MVNEKVAQLVSHRDRDKVRVRLQLLVRAPLHNLLVIPKVKVLGLAFKRQLPDNLLPLNLTSLEFPCRLISAKKRGKWVNQ